jgi:hypothetical protein
LIISGDEENDELVNYETYETYNYDYDEGHEQDVNPDVALRTVIVHFFFCVVTRFTKNMYFLRTQFVIYDGYLC